MSPFTSLKPWATAAIVSLVAAAPAQGQVFNRPSDVGSAVQVGQWQPSPTPSEAASLSSPSQALENTFASRETQAIASSAAITDVYSHRIDDQDAVTLYVRDIPVLTFLGEKDTEVSSAPEVQEAVAGVATPNPLSPVTAAAPMDRAQAVAQKLEAVYGQLDQDNAAEMAIQLAWDQEKEQYWITAGDRPLVALDKVTVAVQPTANLTSDLIRTTNQLRRLMHGGGPLTYTGGRRLQNPAVPASAGSPGPQSVAIAGDATKSTQLGIASWYGGYFHGRRTASGERYNQNAMTAAHRHLPFGTRVRVVNLNNGRATIVRINDRGPFIQGRIIDLSSAAAGEIGMRGSGIARVRVEVLR